MFIQQTRFYTDMPEQIKHDRASIKFAAEYIFFMYCS